MYFMVVTGYDNSGYEILRPDTKKLIVSLGYDGEIQAIFLSLCQSKASEGVKTMCLQFYNFETSNLYKGH